MGIRNKAEAISKLQSSISFTESAERLDLKVALACVFCKNVNDVSSENGEP